jgi:hypothetical protein
MSWYKVTLLYYRFFEKGLGGVRRRCVMRQIGGRVVILGQRSAVSSPVVSSPVVILVKAGESKITPLFRSMAYIRLGPLTAN